MQEVLRSQSLKCDRAGVRQARWGQNGLARLAGGLRNWLHRPVDRPGQRLGKLGTWQGSWGMLFTFAKAVRNISATAGAGASASAVGLASLSELHPLRWAEFGDSGRQGGCNTTHDGRIEITIIGACWIDLGLHLLNAESMIDVVLASWWRRKASLATYGLREIRACEAGFWLRSASGRRIDPEPHHHHHHQSPR